MRIFSGKKFTHGKRFAPTMLLGFFLGVHIAAAVAFLTPGLVAPAEARDLCDGTYPCFTIAACGKAGGSFASCETKCDTGRGYCYAPETPVPLSINIGSISTVVDIGAYVEAVYTYSIGMAAVVATVMMMVGGFQWLTAAGDSGRVTSAKSRINDALVGLLLTVFAWTILNTINPALVKLQMPRVPMVQKKSLVRCDAFNGKVACGQHYALAEIENAPATASDTEKYEIVTRSDSRALTDCTGMGCGLAGSQDGTNTCQLGEGAAGTQPTTAPGESIPEPVGPYECRPCAILGNTCEGIGYNSRCCASYCKITLQGENESIWDRARNRLANDFAGGLGEMYLQFRDSNGICHRGISGDTCFTHQSCRSGKCVKGVDGWNRGGICSSGMAGMPCDDASDCTGDSSCLYNRCIPKVPGGFCLTNEHCPSGLTCRESSTEAAKFCFGGSISSGTIRTSSCSRGSKGDTECSDRYGAGFECMEEGFTMNEPRCTNGQPGSTCTKNEQCKVGGNDGFCDKSLVPMAANTGVCINKEPEAGCPFPGTPADYTPFACVQLARLTSRGVLMARGQAGEPCMTTGSSNTCASGLLCHTEAGVCISSTPSN